MPITYIDVDKSKIGRKKLKINKKKFFLGSLAFIFIFTFTSLVYFYPKLNVLAADFNKVDNHIDTLEISIEKQDIKKIDQTISELNKDLIKTKNDLHRIRIIRFIPIITSYYNDANHGVEAGILSSEAGEIIVDSILPFGDILGLKDVKSDLKAEEKVAVLVTKVIPTISKKTVKLQSYINKIDQELDEIDPNRYPEFIVLKKRKVHDSLVKAQESITKANEFLPTLKNALDVLPSIMGSKQEKTYFIWFQNDKELRPTGGFLTSYGIAKVKDGKLQDISSEDIYSLRNKVTTFLPAPPALSKYMGHTVLPIWDANLSPDYRSSTKIFMEIYDSMKGMPKIDGIIAMDTEMVRKFMEITGPITIKKYNETFSPEPHPKYKIPDVVYKLELYAEKIHAGNPDRKGIVGDLMDEMLHQLFNAPPEKFPIILETFMKSADSKNILFYFKDKKAQSLVEKINFGGRIRDYEMDYLHVNNSNFGGLKGNLYIRSSVEQDIVVANDGTIEKKVLVTLSNIEKADGWLNSVYRNWMRIYVPSGSKLIDKKVYRDFAEKKEFDRKVWESFSLTYPLKSSETSFTYKLPFKIKKGEKYKLRIQKQPGTTDPMMIIRVNGSKLFEFELKKDTDLEFKV